MPVTDSFEQILHGTVIRDPYRWLENRSLPETDDWIRRQQAHCESHFRSYAGWNAIEDRVREYLDVDVLDQPVRIGDRYFYRKRSKGQEQGSIFARAMGSESERVLVDPSENGPFCSVGIYRISPDGSLLAYELKNGGEDRKEIRFVDTNACNALPNRIPRGYGRGIAFSRKGYFYCQETSESTDDHKICYETFGTREDEVVFRVPRTKGSRLLLTGNAQMLGAIWLRPHDADVLTDFWIAEAMDGKPDWIQVFRARRAPYSPILCHGRILVLAESQSGASRFIELSNQGEELRLFGPESPRPVRQIVVTRERIFMSHLDSGVTTVDVLLPNGDAADAIELPVGGTIRLLPVLADDANSIFFSFESSDVPPSIYEHDSLTNTSLLWHKRGPAPDRLRSNVVKATFTSKDGTPIPLTLVYAGHGGAPTGPQPAIMTAYGGFGVTMTPRFSILAAILMESGAIFVLPHIRGGGEFGKAWHDAGRRRNRQRAFDDFVAAAQWLCEQQVTTPDRLAIFGGSNSGLLVGAALTQRPELFRAVLCIAPLLDMLRYESFDRAADWRREYGTIEDPEDFGALFAYSPYHHIAENVNYPATMFVTGDKDSRCNPAHVRKMAARMQNRRAQSSPVIVDYSEERGHSPTLPLSVRVEALARRIAFLSRELRITVPHGGIDEPSHP
jgi:prolyl oligopeptidase